MARKTRSALDRLLFGHLDPELHIKVLSSSIMGVASKLPPTIMDMIAEKLPEGAFPTLKVNPELAKLLTPAWLQEEFVSAPESSAPALSSPFKPQLRQPGRPKEARERVAQQMRAMPASQLASMKEKEMEHAFAASRATCREARREVLGSISAK